MFRHMIYYYAEIFQPIVRLTRKKTPFIWWEGWKDSFNNIQDAIFNKPTLKILMRTVLSLRSFKNLTYQQSQFVTFMQKHDSKFYSIIFFRDNYHELCQGNLPFLESYLQFSLLAGILWSITMVKKILFLLMLNR